MTDYSANAQSRTIPTAEKHGDGWTQYDMDLLLEFTDTETDEEIARMLGRTLYAVWAKQHELRNGHAATGVRRQTQRRVELAYDRGFTDIESLF